MRGFARRGWMAAALAGAAIGGGAVSQIMEPAAAEPRAQAGMTASGAAAALAMVQVGPGGCYPAVSASGESMLQSQAQAAAITAWRAAAASTGLNDYNHAQGKSMTCQRRPPFGRWSCAVTAQPCIPGGTGNPDPNPVCHPQLIATGPWRKLQSTAQNHAVDQWQHDAGNAYGTNYKWWNKSNNRDLSCSHDGRKPILRHWQCRARAEPCR